MSDLAGDNTRNRPILAEAGPLSRPQARGEWAPDTYVAFVDDHPRESFDVEEEGGFPPFVLEVVSPSSGRRDRQEKPVAYAVMGVREYALFTPRAVGSSVLEGYRRDAAGISVEWPPDERGRLWSEVLRLYLVVRGTGLQA